MSNPIPTPHILVVDDETDLMHLVRYNLQKEGFTVFCASDAAQAKQLLAQHAVHLVVLDWMMPDQSGLDLCRELKANPETKPIPVIMLTARSAEGDRIAGFESGAEDYVVKPFSPKELVLRVKALLGRTLTSSQIAAETPIIVGPITIYPAEYRVTVYESPVALTQIEFDILKTLALAPNRVLSREQILSAVWEDDAELILDRTVDAHVKRLRGKLAEGRTLLETVRGVGYRLTSAASLSEAACSITHVPAL
ncbi:MAG: response regulator transcription factor [Vampirovibrionales bacterium]